jgi:ERCC4-type nuclease
MNENPKFIQTYTLKPTPIPEGFVLLQDTREQEPLFKRIPKDLTICSATLKDGDYSIKGFKDKICFERKKYDLWPYCSSEREKTVAKMKRFAKMEFVGLIIELKEGDIYQHQQYSRVHPEVIRAALVSFQVRYGVHVYMGTRENCARYMLDCLTKYYKIKKEV